MGCDETPSAKLARLRFEKWTKADAPFILSSAETMELEGPHGSCTFDGARGPQYVIIGGGLQKFFTLAKDERGQIWVAEGQIELFDEGFEDVDEQ